MGKHPEGDQKFYTVTTLLHSVSIYSPRIGKNGLNPKTNLKKNKILELGISSSI